MSQDAESALAEKTAALFDRVDAYADDADFERALDTLAAGEALCGGLTPSYLAKRARWTAILEAESAALTRRRRWTA